MKADYLLFFKKFIVFAAIICLLDLFSGSILSYLYKTAKSGDGFRENYVMTKTKEDVLVLGSSRALYHYVPSILSDTLNATVFNCGHSGTGIFYYYGAFLGITERYTPKVVILDIDYGDLYPGGPGFEIGSLREHMPFYRKVSKELDSLLNFRSPGERIKLLSHLYRYNTKWFQILVGHLVSSRNDIDGYIPLEGKWQKDLQPYDYTDFKLSQAKYNIIEKFIQKAKEKNIQLVICVSPFYRKTQLQYLYPLENLARKHGVLYLNHIDDPRLLSKRELFRDELHVNVEGAKIYTSIVANEVKVYLADSTAKLN